jgi:two-component sensor histidine kinase
MKQINGAGTPESIDIAATTDFGLQLVDILSEQLERATRLERQHEGPTFILEFDLPDDD